MTKHTTILHPGDIEVVTTVQDAANPQPATQQTIQLPPNATVTINAVAAPAGAGAADYNVAWGSRTLVPRNSATIQFQAPTQLGQKGSIFISSAPQTSRRLVTFQGAEKIGDTPNFAVVVGPTQYSFPGIVSYYGMQPGAFYVVSVKTLNPDIHGFNIDVQPGN